MTYSCSDLADDLWGKLIDLGVMEPPKGDAPVEPDVQWALAEAAIDRLAGALRKIEGHARLHRHAIPSMRTQGLREIERYANHALHGREP